MKSIVPDHAYIAYEWDLCRTWQREQKMFDGSTKTFERVEKHWSVSVFAVSGENILLAYQRQPHRQNWYWDFLGWRVPFGVDMFEQAKTELMEESGMSAWYWKMLWDASVKEFVFYPRQYYIARDLQKIAEQSLDIWWEEIDVRAVSFDNFIEMIITNQIWNDFLRVKIYKMKIEWRLGDFKKELFG